MDKLDVARQFGLLNRRSQAFIANACADMEIAFSECVLLLNLYHRAGINQENMSAILFIDKAATTRTIKSLEKKGFIKREQSDEDKRVKKLYLTQKGEATREPIFAILQRWMEFLSEGMDRETFDTVLKGLKIIAERASSKEFYALCGKEEDERGGTL
ncbi:MAG: transcriptional regulator [Firmicutes bacterium]|nr:transcriptional regulator [Bacillota bacterium]